MGPVTADRMATMVFDREPGMRFDHDRKLLSLIADHINEKGLAKIGPPRGLGGGPRVTIKK